jgi:uncharacterized delta-60 repeat protein
MRKPIWSWKTFFAKLGFQVSWKPRRPQTRNCLHEQLEARWVFSGYSFAGPQSVQENSPYTLNLLTDNPNVTSWQIDWGDGDLQVINGNPQFASHTFGHAALVDSIHASAFVGSVEHIAKSLANDLGFGIGGMVATELPGYGDCEVNSVLQTQDGLLVIGQVLNLRQGGSESAFVVRYNLDGSVDTTFGGRGNGIAIYDTPNYNWTPVLAATKSNGSIVLAGTNSPGLFVDPWPSTWLVQLDQNGHFDAGFGKVNAYPVGIADSPTGITIDSSNRILVAGTTTSWQNDATGQWEYRLCAYVERFYSNGALDTSFGAPEGVDTLTPGATVVPMNDEAKTVLVRAKNNSIVLGVGADSSASIVRLDTDGVRDTSFGAMGVLEFSVDGFGLRWSDISLGAGKAVELVGNYYDENYELRAAIIEVTPFGTLNQQVLTNVANAGPTFDTPMDSAFSRILTDGSVVVMGTTNGGTRIGLTRYDVNGTLDATFGIGGRSVDYSPVNALYGNFGLWGLNVRADGSFDLVGTYNKYNGQYSIRPLVAHYAFGNSLPLSITHIAPTLQISGSTTTLVGAPYYLNLHSEGTTSGTIESWTINWGDGNTETFVGDPSFISHVYLKPGIIWTVTASAIDYFGTYFASPLTVNTSYGGEGTTDPLSKSGNLVASVVRTDGKLISIGMSYSDSEGYRPIVVRYNADGSMDTTFGNQGIFTFPTSNFTSVNAVALTSDNKIVIAYQGLNHSVFNLCRINANGGFDTTFGNGGIVTTFFLPQIIGSSWAVTSGINKIVIQEDGSIIAAGIFLLPGNQQYRLAVVKYNSSGVRNTTFHNTGFLLVSNVDSHSNIAGMASNADGIYLGYTGVVSGRPGFSVARITPSGNLDPSFNSTGTRSFTFDASGEFANDHVTDMKLQADGTVLLVGTVDPTSGLGGSAVAMARVTRQGAFDASFGSFLLGRSVVQSDQAVFYMVTLSAAVGQDGTIFVGGPGYWQIDPNLSDYILVANVLAFNPDGSVKSDFGTGGELVLSSLELDYSSVVAMTFAADGHLIVSDTRTSPQTTFSSTEIGAIHVQPDMTVVPDMATDLTVTSLSSTRVQLTWHNRATNAACYVVERSVDGENWTGIAMIAPSAISYTDNSVTEGSQYFYRVTAKNDVSLADGASGIPSASVSTITPPAAPINVAVAVITPTKVVLNWQNVSTHASAVDIQQRIDGIWQSIGFASGDVTTGRAYGHFTTTGANEFRLVTKVVNVLSVPSNIASITGTAPLPVTDVSVNGDSVDGQILVTWTNQASNAEHNIVERSADGNNWSTLTSLPGTATSYVDNTGIIESTKCYYRITATNGNPGAEGSEVQMGYAAPTAPSDLTLASITSQEVTLTWLNHSIAAREAFVEQYVSGQWTVIGSAFLDPLESDQHTTIRLAGAFSPDATHGFRVVALANSVLSAASNAVSSNGVAPQSVNDLVVATVTDTQVILTWTKNDSHATGYTVQQSFDGEGWTNLQTIPAITTNYSYPVNSLPESKAAYYRVKAIDGAPGGSDSNEVNAITAPIAPTNLVVTDISANLVSLQWVNHSQTANAVYIDQFVDGQWRQLGTASVNLEAASPIGTARLQGTFSPTGANRFRVRAMANGVASVSNLEASATGTAPLAVADLHVSAPSPSAVRLTWTKNDSHAQSYVIWRSQDDETWYSIASVSATSAVVYSYDDANLAASTNYLYKIVAFNDAPGAATSPTQGTYTTPLVPNSLTLVALTDSLVTLRWHDTSAVAETVLVYQQLTDGSWSQIGSAQVDAKSVTHNTQVTLHGNFSTAATNSFKVAAFALGQVSPLSDPVSVTGTPLAPASSLRATGVSDNGIQITWDGKVTNAANFQVQRSSDGSNWTTLAAVPAATNLYVDKTAAQGTSYSYRVASLRGAEAPVPSSIISAKPLPKAPTNLTVTSLSSNQVSLSWQNNTNQATSLDVQQLQNGVWSTVQTITPANASSAPSSTTVSGTYNPATPNDFRVVAHDNEDNEAVSEPTRGGATITAQPNGSAPGFVADNKVGGGTVSISAYSSFSPANVGGFLTDTTTHNTATPAAGSGVNYVVGSVTSTATATGTFSTTVPGSYSITREVHSDQTAPWADANSVTTSRKIVDDSTITVNFTLMPDGTWTYREEMTQTVDYSTSTGGSTGTVLSEHDFYHSLFVAQGNAISSTFTLDTTATYNTTGTSTWNGESGTDSETFIATGNHTTHITSAGVNDQSGGDNYNFTRTATHQYQLPDLNSTVSGTIQTTGNGGDGYSFHAASGTLTSFTASNSTYSGSGTLSNSAGGLTTTGTIAETDTDIRSITATSTFTVGTDGKWKQSGTGNGNSTSDQSITYRDSGSYTFNSTENGLHINEDRKITENGGIDTHLTNDWKFEMAAGGSWATTGGSGSSTGSTHSDTFSTGKGTYSRDITGGSISGDHSELGESHAKSHHDATSSWNVSTQGWDITGDGSGSYRAHSQQSYNGKGTYSFNDNAGTSGGGSSNESGFTTSGSNSSWELSYVPATGKWLTTNGSGSSNGNGRYFSNYQGEGSFQFENSSGTTSENGTSSNFSNFSSNVDWDASQQTWRTTDGEAGGGGTSFSLSTSSGGGSYAGGGQSNQSSFDTSTTSYQWEQSLDPASESWQDSGGKFNTTFTSNNESNYSGGGSSGSSSTGLNGTMYKNWVAGLWVTTGTVDGNSSSQDSTSYSGGSSDSSSSGGNSFSSSNSQSVSTSSNSSGKWSAHYVQSSDSWLTDSGSGKSHSSYERRASYSGSGEYEHVVDGTTMSGSVSTSGSQHEHVSTNTTSQYDSYTGDWITSGDGDGSFDERSSSSQSGDGNYHDVSADYSSDVSGKRTENYNSSSNSTSSWNLKLNSASGTWNITGGSGSSTSTSSSGSTYKGNGKYHTDKDGLVVDGTQDEKGSASNSITVKSKDSWDTGTQNWASTVTKTEKESADNKSSYQSTSGSSTTHPSGPDTTVTAKNSEDGQSDGNSFHRYDYKLNDSGQWVGNGAVEYSYSLVKNHSKTEDGKGNDIYSFGEGINIPVSVESNGEGKDSRESEHNFDTADGTIEDTLTVKSSGKSHSHIEGSGDITTNSGQGNFTAKLSINATSDLSYDYSDARTWDLNGWHLDDATNTDKVDSSGTVTLKGSATFSAGAAHGGTISGEQKVDGSFTTSDKSNSTKTSTTLANSNGVLQPTDWKYSGSGKTTLKGSIERSFSGDGTFTENSNVDLTEAKLKESAKNVSSADFAINFSYNKDGSIAATGGGSAKSHHEDFFSFSDSGSKETPVIEDGELPWSLGHSHVDITYKFNLKEKGGHSNSADVETTWVIDAENKWRAEKTTASQSGNLYGEQEYKYDVSRKEKMDYYKNGASGDKSISKTVTGTIGMHDLVTEKFGYSYQMSRTLTNDKDGTSTDVVKNFGYGSSQGNNSRTINYKSSYSDPDSVQDSAFNAHYDFASGWARTKGTFLEVDGSFGSGKTTIDLASKGNIESSGTGVRAIWDESQQLSGKSDQPDYTADLDSLPQGSHLPRTYAEGPGGLSWETNTPNFGRSNASLGPTGASFAGMALGLATGGSLAGLFDGDGLPSVTENANNIPAINYAPPPSDAPTPPASQSPGSSNGVPGFWDNYFFFLTHPSRMDSDLQTYNKVGYTMIAVGAGGLGGMAATSAAASLGAGTVLAGTIGGGAGGALGGAINGVPTGTSGEQALWGAATGAVLGGALSYVQKALSGLCFAAGTLVATETGQRAIESIQPGDKVWSYDLIGREWQLCTVLKTFVRDYENDSVFVTCGGETVESTFLHPYWVYEGEDLASRPVLEHHRGLMPDNCRTPGRWVDAGYLRVGDVLLLRDGRLLPVENVRMQPVHQNVFNFSVDRLQNYAVGPLGLLVHNTNGAEEAIEQASTKLNNLKGHILEGELDAARREVAGEIVKLKSSGVPFDHVKELTDAKNGLLKVIKSMKKILGRSDVSEAEREAATNALSEASKLLDLAKEFLP